MFFVGSKAKQGVKTTGRLMRRLAVVFSGDVMPYVTLSLQAFYDKVRNIPYHEDPKGIELVQRPALTLNGQGLGGDCDDKAICMAAYLHLHDIKFRIVAAGRDLNGPLHHTWVQGYINGKWSDLDPTYQWNSLGQRIGRWDKFKVIG